MMFSETVNPNPNTRPRSCSPVRVQEDYRSELDTGIHPNKVVVNYEKDGIVLQSIENKFASDGKVTEGDPLFVENLSSDKNFRSLFEVRGFYKKGQHLRLLNSEQAGICTIEDGQLESGTYIAVLGADSEYTLCLAPLSFKEIDAKRTINDIPLKSVVQHSSFFRTEKPSSGLYQEDSDRGAVRWAGLLKLRRSTEDEIDVCIKGWSGHYKAGIKHFESIIKKLESLGFDEERIVVIGMNGQEYNPRIFKDTFAKDLLEKSGIHNAR